MKITLPEFSLVVLIGASGSGKSTFARKHFKNTEILSSDYCRGLISDDENDQSVSKQAFEVLYFIAAKRLAAAKLTVIDATNVQPEDRKHIIALARQYHCLPVAIVLNLPEQLCHERNQFRPDRSFGFHVVHRQTMALRHSLRGLEREGFRNIHVLNSQEQVDAVEIERQPLWNNLKYEHGPFDIIGDIHGCFTELYELFTRLGYQIELNAEQEYRVQPPPGRKVIFLGDLVDRGPATPSVLRLAMDMVKTGSALCVPGNHDVKLLRYLKGKDVHLSHGLAETVAQLSKESVEFKARVAAFLDERISHYVLDDGKLVVAHAGLKESMQGRGSGAVRDFALYGETTGETDEFGLPVRNNWAAEYRGKAMVVYGHTPVPEPEWLNNTMNIDTGCVFGGSLTAFRYPERELVSVPAGAIYWESTKPFLIKDEKNQALTTQQLLDDVLDMEDVSGKRVITTRLHAAMTIREENAIAALEIMSRFAANPKWLIYLPPTMSPSETSTEPGLLEHPAQAFAYYQREEISKVVCEEKHMGSRAVVIVGRDEDAIRKHFGITNEGIGICYTRTGRHFFDDPNLESELLNRVCAALTRSGFWEQFQTDWVCLDCELMPWSVKAQSLISQQYAAVGAASTEVLGEAVRLLQLAEEQQLEVGDLLSIYTGRQKLAKQYVDAYRRYCWPVKSIADLKLAPFHILATQGEVHSNKNHLWHMEHIAEICKEDEQLLLLTAYKVIEVADEISVAAGVDWWQELTAGGAEGMVVKPLDFIVKGRHGLVQPAIKCRGPEYLRIIYGPDYTMPENLDRLRQRGLGRKRSLALREFSLGIEGLERFVGKEPLRRVHECAFGVLALESEPVDPRL